MTHLHGAFAGLPDQREQGQDSRLLPERLRLKPAPLLPGRQDGVGCQSSQLLGSKALLMGENSHLVGATVPSGPSVTMGEGRRWAMGEGRGLREPPSIPHATLPGSLARVAWGLAPALQPITVPVSLPPDSCGQRPPSGRVVGSPFPEGAARLLCRHRPPTCPPAVEVEFNECISFGAKHLKPASRHLAEKPRGRAYSLLEGSGSKSINCFLIVEPTLHT